ncbi:MAG: pitrilysin family protein [Candidatus Omnitrophica bacterium]|nr:pitrilysin family protein [Candidatus Omnitrophota bacterium]
MYKVERLDNGLVVATKSMSHMESVSLGVWIRAGGRHEDTKNNGISHLLEHLLFKGTKTRDMRRIKEDIEGRGGTFNGFTTEEFTCYLVKLLAKDMGLGVDILSDMVLHPRLAEEEIEKEKNVIIEEINMYKDIPGHYVHEVLSELLWPGEPLGMPLAGSEESVRSLTKDDIESYRQTYYNPKNMLLVGTGLLKEEGLLELSRKYLSSSGGKDAPPFKKFRREQKRQGLKINFKQTEQTHLALGFHSLDRFNPDRYALSLVNILLGANMSSRLFHIVRDEMALCYEISSSLRKFEDTGAFVISAGVDEKKLVKALEVILKVLDSMRREPVLEEELRRAKEYYRGQLLFALEETMSFMLWLGEKIVSGEKDFSVRKILDNIESVSAEDIMRVSKAIFCNEKMNLAIIGPVKESKEVERTLQLS